MMEIKKRKPYGYWKDKDNVIEESKKYSTRTEFKRKSNNAYDAARLLGLLDSMTWLDRKDGKLKCGYWKIKKNMMNEARKYKTKEEFKNNNLTAFLAAYRYGYIEDMPWLVTKKQHKKGYWTYDNIAIEALKYSTKTEFFKGNQTAYKAALKLGVIDDFFGIDDYVDF